MTNKLVTTFTLLVFIVLVFGLMTIMTNHYANLPERISQHETLIMGQTRLSPGSQAALRVVVRDSKDAAPLPDSEIEISLVSEDGGKPAPVFTGKTDSLGTANVAFRIPDGVDGKQTLVVSTRSRFGSDIVEQPITVARDYRVVLTTDKPLYQPGQVIHIRALALGSFDLTPAAGEILELIIADGKGNKVYREKRTLDDYGVAAADFQLASQVNTGPYKITASLLLTDGAVSTGAPVSTEKTVTVEHYVLPKFDIKITPERTYYSPGQTVKGSLDADYFFGKPVSGGQIILEGYTFDVARNVIFQLQGETDEEGRFEFEFDLPDYIAGSDLEAGLGRFYLSASVTDQAEHTETANLSLPVAKDAVVVEAIPEAGRFLPGVENIIYLLTSYPDGSPAETRLRMFMMGSGEVTELDTGPYGLAQAVITPDSAYQEFQIEAEDAAGGTGFGYFSFGGEYYEESVLLRPERPIYQVGETMRLNVFTSQPQGSVFVDIIREGQTISTRAVDVKDGQAALDIDLSPDMFGVLEVHAYKVQRSGVIIRDSRLVVVDSAAALNLALTPDQDVYRPGDQANLNVQVSGEDGLGVPSSLGLAVVDESVFALAEQDPGFARLYFMLEQELLEPKYDLHGFSVPDLLGGLPESQTGLQEGVEHAAQASLAAAAPQGLDFSLRVNSHDVAMQNAYERQERYFAGLSNILYGILLLLPLGVTALSVVAAVRQKRFWVSLGAALAVPMLFLMALVFWPVSGQGSWSVSPLYKLEQFIQWLSWRGEALILVFAALALLSFLALAVIAILRKDLSLGGQLGLIVLLIAVLVFLIYAVEKAGISPDDTVVAWGILAFLLLPLAFLLRSGVFAWEKRWLPSVAAMLVGMFLMTAFLPLMAEVSMAASPMRGMQADGAANWAAPGAPPMFGGEAEVMEEPAIAAEVVTQSVEKSAADTGSAVQAPRLRQYFPETMFWLPDGVTGPDGQLDIEIPIADSITTWRITALASSQDGRLGSATGALRVFQDFFIDLDLPLALTVGDEVSIPVGVYNYLPDSQRVSLELEQSGWFELLDDSVKEIEIAANDIDVVYFRVRALEFGRQPFQVTALGEQMSDAIRKEVNVYPDGKQFNFTQSDRLEAGEDLQVSVPIPPDAIPGTQTLMVKIYPGVLSQVVEGLDSILRMPNGCFEQTSSATYPNVLVLDYLKTTGQASPETQFKAEEYINLGYQRLMTFEVGSTGGFSLFGDAPADRMLTAYGLQEFADMSRVHPVDEAVIDRAAQWLLSQQDGDGSWENDQGLVHESTWSNLENDRLPVTAYIVWSLVEAGYLDDAGTQEGLAYVREHQSSAEDAYVLALVANALVAADLKAGGPLQNATEVALDRLAALAVPDGSGVYWQSGVATFMGSEGKTSSVETTALAALAFLRSGAYTDLGNGALTTLVKEKDSFGTWYSTQATVLALKALLESTRGGAENVNAAVTVSLNGSQERQVQVNQGNFDVVQLIAFDDVNPGRENQVTLTVEGEGNLMYQVTAGYYLPWDIVPSYAVGGDELVSIDVAYDRTELEVNDTVGVNVTLALNEKGARAESAIIDLGLPPGFTVEAEDLSAMVAYYNDTPEDYAFAKIERFELTGRQIIIYLTNLSYGNPLEFSYRLRAKFPLEAQAPASTAYDYYNPDQSGEAQPQILVVNP